jgi:CMP-N,N'-diacetyllegionaminic acid synthase
MSPSPTRSCVALIPARGGSKRVLKKNTRELGGTPLVGYAVKAALGCDFFSQVVVSTDCSYTAGIASEYGATPLIRPAEFSGDTSPDIEWVRHALGNLDEFDCFSILRPTNPFRTTATIQRAWQKWSQSDTTVYDSLRAVERCSQHPGKMWRVQNDMLIPLLLQPDFPAPWHSQQYAALPEVFVQNASLEIAWCRTAMEKNSIAGDVILPFFTQAFEGFDINTELDWALAELILRKNLASV